MRPHTSAARVPRACTLLFSAMLAALGAGLGAQSPTPTWSARLEWRLRDDPSGAWRTDVIPAAVATRGDSLVAALPLDRTLLLIDRDGRIVRTFGRAGAGPGEIERPSAVGLLGDTVWVADAALQRFTRYAPGSRPAVTRSFRDITDAVAPRTGSAAGRLWPHSLLANGRILVLSPLPPDPRSAAGSGRSVALLADTSARRVDTLGVLDERNAWFLVGRGGADAPSTMRFRNPFAHKDLLALDPYGRRTVLVQLQDAASPRAPSYTVSAWGADGRRIFSRRIPFTPRAVTGTDVAEAANGFREIRPPARSGGAGALDVGPALSSAVGKGSVHPPVTRLLVGADQSIWLRRSTGRADRDTWLVLSAAGDPLAEVHLPRIASRVVVAADLEHIWAVEDDERAATERTLVRYRVSP